MKLREVEAIETPYAGVDTIAYTNEKKRLQVAVSYTHLTLPTKA